MPFSELEGYLLIWQGVPNMKKTNSIIIAALLLMSFGWMITSAGFVTAQSGPDPVLHVGWEVVDDIEHFSHDEEHSEWVFGPQPTIWIGYAEDWVWNGTTIDENGFRVDAGDQILINISIPYEFLHTASVLDAVGFWGVTQPLQRTAFGMEYNVTRNTWNSVSFHYVPDVAIPIDTNFMDLSSAHCSYENDTINGSYDIVFAVVFNREIVNNVFWTGMQAVDTSGRPISPSWLAKAAAGEYATPPIGLGMEVPPNEFEFPRYYYAEIVDDVGELLHWVDVDDPFKFRMVSNEPFGEVMIPFAVLSYDPAFAYNYTWTMKENPADIASDDVIVDGMPLMLFYIHNSTGAYAVGGYLDNITWVPVPIVNVWSVTFDILLNHTLDLSLFYNEIESDYSPTHQEIWWSGSFTDLVDMNAEDHLEGATIRGEPFFWTVKDLNGRDLNARQEIRRKNTVQLAFKTEFIEAFVLNEYGDIAERAMPNQMLNISMDVHAPVEIINGSQYIPLNQYNVEAAPSTFFDIDGVQVNTTLHNFTISVGGYGTGANRTHTWTYAIRHYITLDFIGDAIYEFSVFVIEVRNAVTRVVEDLLIFFPTNFIEVYGYDLTLGSTLTELDVQFNITANAPAAIYDDVTVEVGLAQDFGWNYSVAGDNNYNWVYDSGTVKEEIQEDIIWSPHRLIIGDIPFWEEPVWSVTPEGAIDLDGNEFTTDDQYYVKRTARWQDTGNITVDAMGVVLVFDPTPGRNGDEFWSESWMGVAKMVMEYQASEEFYWYHASNVSLVDSETMDEIKDTLWAYEDPDIPAPGYEMISWMSKNRTDIHTNIPGLESGVWENTWFAWGTRQTFWVTKSEAQVELARFRASYAGLLLFNDIEGSASEDAPDFRIVEGQVVTDEVTHFVLIEDVESVEFRQPFGATNGSGSVTVDPETPVEFGISIYNVDVTIYPLQIRDSDGIRGAWDYRESYEAISSLTNADFDYWISTGNVTEMAFDISFNIDLVEYDPEDEATWNHAVSFKVDQVFGEWNLDDFDDDVLLGRGLAVNFFGILGTGTRTQYRVDDAPITDTNSDSLSGSYYEFGADDSPYANVTMGGLPYYAANDSYAEEHISGSSTAPLGAFSVMYSSASGQTVTDWTVEASMLFMTAGYTEWGGHEILCDPVFVSYSSAFEGSGTTTPTATTTTSTTTTGNGELALYLMIGGGVVIVVLVLVLIRRRD